MNSKPKQTAPINQPRRNLPKEPIEWPTWLLIATIYGGWAGTVLAYRQMPPWLAHTLLVLLSAWHLSLQHELLHGHPTRSKSINRLFGLLPLSVWFPFDIYRDSHLSHHRDKLLTTPGVDPEANYLTSGHYRRLSRLHQVLRLALRTTLGRFLLGPATAIYALTKDTAQDFLRGDWRYLGTWALHMPLLVLLLWWMQAEAGISPLYYLAGVAYPALGLAMLRSFYEHRPASKVAHRTVINEAALPWRLLYLNNNYHAVHHDLPNLAWYRIPAAYRADAAGFAQRNQGFVLPGYTAFLLKHAVKPVDSPEHPGFH